jgi:pimeloyl-ACP methyl ester carboxylesterase
MQEILGQITCPVLLFWGTESWASDPEIDSRVGAIPQRTIVKVRNAGHWLHHDQLAEFLDHSMQFLQD